MWSRIGLLAPLALGLLLAGPASAEDALGDADDDVLQAEPAAEAEAPPSETIQSGGVEAEAPPPSPSAPLPPPPPPGPPPGPYYAPGYYGPPPMRREDPTRHRHDGFYMRIALGAGAMRGEVDGAELSGAGAALDFWIGGTPAPGLVLGGALSGNAAQDPRTPSGELDGATWGASLLGPFVDWFPDPRGGFHVGAMIGLAAISVEEEGQDPLDLSGAGGSFFVGYGAWIGSQWSLGGLVRVTGASASERDDSTVKGSTRSLSFLVTALHH